MAAQAELEITKEMELRKPSAMGLLSPTPMELLAAAIDRGLSPEQLQALIQMAREWKKDLAQEAYVASITAFKKNPPHIAKTRPVTYEKGPSAKPAYFYAPLENVCDAVIKALNEHGLTHHWEYPTGAQGTVSVSCYLTHEKGHTGPPSTLSAPPDTSGGKNAIQANISTVSYLERITLLGACGIATGMPDNDGAGMTNGWLAEKLEFLDNCRSLKELEEQFKVAVNEALDHADKKSIQALKDKKNQLVKEKF